MKKRIYIFITAFVLTVSLTAITASADVCPISGCNATLNTILDGYSPVFSASHQYGGLLGLFTKTCNYSYYNAYYSQKCNYNHVTGTYSVRWESGHICN